MWSGKEKLQRRGEKKKRKGNENEGVRKNRCAEATYDKRDKDDTNEIMNNDQAKASDEKKSSEWKKNETNYANE